MKVSVSVHVDADQFGVTDTVEAGERALNAVLFDFNPTSNAKVTRIKAMHAALIQEMCNLQDDATSTPAQKRAAAIAITELEGTQMRAVKALFAK